MFRLKFVSMLFLSLLSCVITGWSSPIYSSNGIGIVIPDDTGQSRGMGGAGIANDSGKIMMRGNPALLGSFKQHSFSMGVFTDRNTVFTGGRSNPTFTNTTLDLFKLVLPIAKGFVFGWGLSPFSRTDSIIKYSGDTYTDMVTYKGGLNVSSVGIAGSYRDIVRLGISFNYNFGMIEEEWSRTFIQQDNLAGTYDWVKRKYTGYSTTFGILAHVLKNTTVGIGYTGKADLDLSVHVRPGSYSNPEQEYSTMKTALPANWRFGVTSVFNESATASMDISLTQWEKSVRTPEEKVMYTDTYNFGAGMRISESQEYNASFFRKFPISAGFKFGTMYYKSYPKVDTVFERAFTLGIEIPFIDNMASIISSFEFGIRGDKSKNGWEENYTNIGLLLIGTIK